MPDEISTRLFAHQKEGVQWLLNLHASPYPGGILGRHNYLSTRLINVIAFLQAMTWG